MADHQETLEIEVKALDGLTIKDEDKGEIESVIATLNVVDRDRDFMRPGAIKDGSRVKISDYGHSAAFGAPPVGKGVLRVKGDQVVFQGKYFMSTTRGVEAFRTMKEIGPDDQEWSFGFHIEKSDDPTESEKKQGAYRSLASLDSFEVSPVMRGAGIGTRTVSVKAAGGKPPLGDPPVVTVVTEDGTAEVTQPERTDTTVIQPLDAETQAIAAAFETKQLEDAARTAAEQAIADAEAQRVAQEAEAKRQVEEAEVTRLVAAEIKRLRDAAADEFERFQRTFRYLGAA